MKTKKILVIIMLVGIFFSLTACTKKLKDATVKEDVETSLAEELDTDETIEKINILSRRANKDTNDTSVNIEVITSNDEISYVKYFMAVYHLSDKEGWYLTSFFGTDSDKWTATPIKGISEESIKSSLTGQFIHTENDTWEIEKRKISSISIVKQETNLKELKDTVTVDLTLDSAVQQAKGRLTIEYTFDKKWKIKSISGSQDFTVQTKPECALNVTTEELIAELVKKEVVVAPASSDRQTVTMSIDEISNFEIIKESSQEKGTFVRYDCKCTLTKKHTILEIEASYNYHYEGSEGWKLQVIHLTPQVTSVNIIGEWNGTYSQAGEKGTAKLTITEFTPDGIIKGVYAYTPYELDTWSQPGSYAVSGTIDLSTMYMQLAAGDWIIKDSKALSVTKIDVWAILKIDKSQIHGIGQESCSFVVSQ